MNQKDRKYFEVLGKALNPPVEKRTKQERLRAFDFGAYLDFLARGRDLMVALKGKLSPNPASAVEIIHRKAVALKFIKKPS
ncbi:MAG: hypothetical protein Q7T11_07760 [Deltaproteobacteria bacterium]|nr:hypothetical protein [Deltaproteobacteria bacterium]